MLASALLLGAGCAGRDAGADAPGVPSGAQCLYWQVGDGEAASPRAVATAIASLAPDLAVLELTDHPDDILQALQAVDPAWDNIERLSGDSGALVLVSRLGFLSTQSAHEITYRIGGEEQRIRYGILDVIVQLRSGVPLHIIGVSIKDKIFDPAGQTEMRRNELRLVGRHLQRVIETTPTAPVLLVGALNDIPAAAPLRALTGGPDSLLRDLRPVDTSGDAWTVHEPETDQYVRHHYALIRSDSLAAAGRILDTPALRACSRNRPLWIELSP